MLGSMAKPDDQEGGGACRPSFTMLLDCSERKQIDFHVFNHALPRALAGLKRIVHRNLAQMIFCIHKEDLYLVTLD